LFINTVLIIFLHYRHSENDVNQQNNGLCG